MNQRLIIACTPRSGSKWLADRLQECGLDVGHEKEGKDGIVSYMAHLDMATQSDKLKDTSGLRVHLIRDPAESIASMVARGMPSQSTVDFIDPGLVLNAAQFWSRWTAAVDKWADRTVSLHSLVNSDPNTWGVIGLDPKNTIPGPEGMDRVNSTGIMSHNRTFYNCVLCSRGGEIAHAISKRMGWNEEEV